MSHNFFKFVFSLLLMAAVAGCVSDEVPELPVEEPEPPRESPLVRTIKNFDSYPLELTRTLRILMPQNYETTTESYPVIYFHDGKNVFHPGGQFGSWAVEEAYSRLVEAGKIREAILVGIGNTSQRVNEYTPTPDNKNAGGQADKYLDFLEKNLIPYMKANYRVLDGAQNTGLAGSSLGGLVSLYAAWTRPQVFGMAGCFSTSLWWDDGNLLNQVFASPPPAVRSRIYIDTGNQEGPDPDGNGASSSVEDTLAMTLGLARKGWTYGKDLLLVLDPNGEHNERFWRQRAEGALQFLLGPPLSAPSELTLTPSRKAMAAQGGSRNLFVFAQATWAPGLRADIPQFFLDALPPVNGPWGRTTPLGGVLLKEPAQPGMLQIPMAYQNLKAPLNLQILP